MKFFGGLLTGLLLSITLHLSKSLAASIWVSNPPETYAEYPGPKVRIWKNGVEVV